MNNKVQEIMKEIEKNPNIKLWKDFTWPDQIPLTTRLKDILEKTVDEKYYLSGDKVESILANFIARQNEASGINIKNQATTFDGLTDVAHTLMARDYKGFGNQSMTGVIEPSIEVLGHYMPSGHEASRVVDADGIAPTVMSNSHGTTSGRYTSPKILVDENQNTDKVIEVGNIYPSNGENGNIYDVSGLSPTLKAGTGVKGNGIGSNNAPKVVEPFIVASRGRNPENPSDRTTGSPTEQRLEANMNGTTNTITTVAKDNYVMEPVVCEQRCDEGLRFFKNDVVGTLCTIDACGDKRVIEPELTQIGTIDGDGHEIRRRVYDTDGISPTLCGVGSGGNTEPKVLIKDEDVNPVRIGNIYGEQFGTGYAGNVWDQDSVSPTIMTAQDGNRQPLVVDNIKWRIRKLTPKECWRLMSFSDEDYNRASKYVSDSALYKQAGNSIVTSCLVAIFYSLLFNDNGTNWSDYIVQYKINGGNV